MVTRPFSLAGVALLSCAALAYEVGLTRLFAVQQFYHFAFLVIGLAVLGIAASGVILSLGRRPPSLPLLAWAFALAVVAAFALLQGLPFDSYSLAWDARQAAILVLYVLATGTPFLLSGWVTAACLAQSGRKSRLPYAASLLGGSVGGPLALWVGSSASGEAVLFIAVSLALIAAAAFSTSSRARAAALVVAALCWIPAVRLPAAWGVRLSPYKPLAMALQLPDAELRLTEWSPTTRLDVVEASAFHIFPGLRLNASIDLPAQAGLFLDGEGPLPLAALDPDDPSASRLAADLPSSMAYQLRPGAEVLLLRPAAGMELALALASGAQSATAVFDEPAVVDLLRGPFFDLTYRIAADARVHIVSASARSALARLPDPYSLIEVTLRDPDRPIRSGAFSLNEEYGLTLEAFDRAFDHLTPDGLFVITRWLGTPPSDETRAWATLVSAADRPGLPPVDARLLAYRSMRTATLIASPSAFSSGELATARSFLEQNGYDPIYMPGLRPEELNRHNRLPQDVYHEIFAGLLRHREATIRSSAMDIRPTTDDRPFYFQFFRWGQTPEILAELGRTWQPFGGSGFLILIFLLAVVLILSLALVALPLARLRMAPTGAPPAIRRTAIYFAAIGLGYMLVEVSLIQQLTLLLDKPAYALAAVLTILLLTSGIGSLLSGRLRLRPLFLVLTALLPLLAWGLPLVTPQALAWPLGSRLALVVVLLSPLGILMGVPFARGLASASTDAGGLVPLAWAANGSASAVAGVLAALLALSFGLRATLLAGGLAYVLAWLASPEGRNPNPFSFGKRVWVE